MGLLGITEPRLYTEQRGELTPQTTYGHDLIEFARNVCGIELLDWQKWWALHALEKNPDGSLRFRRIVTVVARQNGKSYLLRVLALWLMVRFPKSTVLGVAQLTTTADESWDGCVQLTEEQPALQAMRTARDAVRRSNGSARLRLDNGSRYLTAAANRRAGRGLSINLLVLDELRELRTWEAFSALAPTISAQKMGVIVAITNMGDDQSVVLNSLRDAALAGVEDGIAVFEWSAPEGADIADTEGWRAANPGLGVTVQEADLRIALVTEPPHVFRTERLNQRVQNTDEAIDLVAWGECADAQATLDSLRDRVSLCIDASPDGKHVTLVAAAVREDGRIALEAVDAWDSTSAALAALPAWIERVGPVAVGYFASGPSAALKPALARLPKVRELSSPEAVSACMGLADQVASRRILHTNQDLLNAHISNAQRMRVGDGWRFVRTDSGQCDAAYAAAGAVLLARLQPSPKGKPRILIARAA